VLEAAFLLVLVHAVVEFALSFCLIVKLIAFAHLKLYGTIFCGIQPDCRMSPQTLSTIDVGNQMVLWTSLQHHPGLLVTGKGR
jgi:hypothetical protein